MAAYGMEAVIVPSLTTKLSEYADDVEVFSPRNKPVTWEVKTFWRKGSYIGEPERELMNTAREKFMTLADGRNALKSAPYE